MSDQLLRAGIVGYRGMGRGLAQIVDSLDEYTLVAGCDLVEERLQALQAAHPQALGYLDYAQMLAEAELDVVIVATNNVTHAPLTIQAAQAGVRGIYCEKPMASNLADGQAMVAACQQNNVKLAINHQRRLLPVFQTMHDLMQSGAIGEIELIRAGCAGDVLSDGTHLIDTVRYLAGDAEVSRIFGQIYRSAPDPDESRGMGYDASGGWRYGHPVENGAMAILEFSTGLRVELFTGGNQPKGRRYQDYEIFGSKGRLHRNGDQADPPVLIQTDDQAGWRPVTIDAASDYNPIAESFRLLARTIETGEPHPLAGDSALKVLEITMAIYESARLRNWLTLPLEQPRFPLDILIENGEMSS